MRGARNEGELRRYLVLTRSVLVFAGPFYGMSYVAQSCGSAWSPKILGTYELEIAPIFDGRYLAQFDRVVDIGCAEGYYLAGIGSLLRRGSNKKVQGVSLVGYDTDVQSMDTARALAERNQLMFELHNRRLTKDDVLEGRSFYIVDIEGEEQRLLDKVFFSRAWQSDFLVEIHDEPGSKTVLQKVIAAASDTHSIEVITRVDRQVLHYPKGVRLPIRRKWAVSFMQEHRQYGNTWIHLKSKGIQSNG
jgi:SAM-dependent methyltransferase